MINLRKKTPTVVVSAVALAAMMLPALAMNPQIALATSHGDPIDPPGGGNGGGGAGGPIFAGTPCDGIVALTAIQEQSNVQDAIAQDLKGPSLAHVINDHGENVAGAVTPSR